MEVNNNILLVENKNVNVLEVEEGHAYDIFVHVTMPFLFCVVLMCINCFIFQQNQYKMCMRIYSRNHSFWYRLYSFFLLISFQYLFHI